jgi:hypothetical protein
MRWIPHALSRSSKKSAVEDRITESCSTSSSCGAGVSLARRSPSAEASTGAVTKVAATEQVPTCAAEGGSRRPLFRAGKHSRRASHYGPSQSTVSDAQGPWSDPGAPGYATKAHRDTAAPRAPPLRARADAPVVCRLREGARPLPTGAARPGGGGSATTLSPSIKQPTEARTRA